MTRTDAEGFPAVRAQDGPVAEVVMIDPVKILLALRVVEADGQQNALVALARKVVVIHPVVTAVEAHPVITVETLGGVVIIDNALRDAAVVAPFVLGGPEGDHLARRGEAVAEDQAFDLYVLAGDLQVGLPLQENLPFFLGDQANGGFLRSPAPQYPLLVGVGTVGDRQHVARPGFRGGLRQVGGAADQAGFFPTAGGQAQEEGYGQQPVRAVIGEHSESWMKSPRVRSSGPAPGKISNKWYETV